MFKNLRNLFSIKKTQNIDIEKRNSIIKKYDLLNINFHQIFTFVTLEEFFEGNNDCASFGVNLEKQPPITVFYKTLKQIKENIKVAEILVQISDINIYEDDKLDDNEWFYSDSVYIIGNMELQDIEIATKNIQPDEIYILENEKEIKAINEKDNSFHDKKVIVLWWD